MESGDRTGLAANDLGDRLGPVPESTAGARVDATGTGGGDDGSIFHGRMECLCARDHGFMKKRDDGSHADVQNFIYRGAHGVDAPGGMKRRRRGSGRVDAAGAVASTPRERSRQRRGMDAATRPDG